MASEQALQTLVCLSCSRPVAVQPSVSVLGFQKFTCPACGVANTHPLTPAYRKSYQIATPIVMLMTLIGLWIAKPLIPGIGFIVMAYALVRDRALVRAVKDAARPSD